MVIGELKLSFNLELVLQAVDRAGCRRRGLARRKTVRARQGRESDARYRNLCRRLGFGMLAVTNTGDVEVIVKPATTAPRRNPKKRSRLVANIDGAGRSGDGRLDARADHDGIPPAGAGAPRAGGRATTRKGFAGRHSRCRKNPAAQRLWLVRLRAERGIYVLTDAGHAALKRWPQQPLDLNASAP